MGFEVDGAFFQDHEHRPKPTITVAGGIPVIDLSPLKALDSNLLRQVEAACRDWGFFQVINHGVPSELLERLHAAAKKFFHLPMEEKHKVKRDEENPIGYYDTEHTKNVRDWKEVFDFVLKESVTMPALCKGMNGELQTLRNQWPHYPPELREACQEYGCGVEKLAFQVLQLISLTLNLPAKQLDGYFTDQLSFIRLNHYPPCPVPNLALGVGRHKDAGALTVLAQDDVGGLDVKRRSDGEWVRVQPIPDSYIINVGDIVQVWSNDKYESAEHRVSVNSERERFSFPFFFNPSHYVMVKPLQETTNEKNPPKYKEYNWGDFFSTRKTSNFMKLKVDNIQISHFRVKTV